ncbi:MAG: nucleotidyl transferase AbiEii/AbiGii toxin family protein [Rhodothermales bacterium]
MATVSDVLADLDTLFQRRGIDWYVFGAQAVVVFGRPRQTLDIDVTIDLAVEEISELAVALYESGYEARVDELEQFVRRTRAAPVVHAASGIPVDIIFAGPGLEREFLERAVPVDIENARIPFLSPEDLVAIKILAGRPKDLEDVRGILEKQGPALDEARVRDILERLERALDRSDLVPTYESLSRL